MLQSFKLRNIDEQYSNNEAIIALYTTHIWCQIHTNSTRNAPNFDPIFFSRWLTCARGRERERERERKRESLLCVLSL